MADDILIYRRSQDTADSALRQGEILSHVNQVHLDIMSVGIDKIEVQIKKHPFAVVLSQDCDLNQDFDSRADSTKPDKRLPSVFLCEVVSASGLKGTGITSDIWKRVRNNKDERYQFLQRIKQEEDALDNGIEELGVDFKRYFTLPTDELYKSIKIGITHRRSVLKSPYMEHLAVRFANYLSRIALPADHLSE